MANYHLTRKALSDLDGIYEYGILTFGLRRADVYYDGLIERFGKLANHPQQYPAVDHFRPGYRRSVYHTHSIYYYIKGSDIEIIRVLGHQDPDRHL